MSRMGRMFPCKRFAIWNVLLILALLIFCARGARAEEGRWQGAPVDFSQGDLRVSADGHHLQFANGKGFFFLGDTAWEMFHRLKRAEMENYLEDRRSKGFTVIQAVVLAEFDGLTQPNAEGNLPLAGSDPAHPNERYFELVDYGVRTARAKGMFVGMLPTWGDKMGPVLWGKGPMIFNEKNAYAYGLFLGRRYAKDANVIWILGGDRMPTEHEQVWRAMAKGLREGDKGRHLITYHPGGGKSSSDGFTNADSPLDFNMMQSGHGSRHFANYAMVEKDYALRPVKPTVDGEARYEDHPVNFKPENGWFTDADTREAAYWAVFAGSAGFTYGCHDIWQFLDTSRNKPVTFARTPWQQAMNFPGSLQMLYLRRLMESHDFLRLVPAQEMIVAAEKLPDSAELLHVAALKDGNGRTALIYVPAGVLQVTVDVEQFGGGKSTWFDPTTGKSLPAVAARQGTQGTFRLPMAAPGEGHDWVLVVEADLPRK